MIAEYDGQVFYNITAKLLSTLVNAYDADYEKIQKGFKK